MPSDKKEEFKNVFLEEYKRRNVTYNLVDDDEGRALHIYKELILYAQKVE